MTVEKMTTGIDGLDFITSGGLPVGRATLAYGRPGVGKTIMAMQWLSSGARAGEPGVVVTFEQAEARLIADMTGLRFGFPEAVESGTIDVIDFRPAVTDPVSVGAFTLDPMLVRIRHAIDKLGAKRLVIESVDALFSALQDSTRLRWELTRLLDELGDAGVTTLLVAEEEARDTASVEYLADCVVHLTHRLQDRIATRYMRVSKYRGSSHIADAQPFLITDNGLSVLAVDSRLSAQVSEEQVSTGVEALDELLKGGYYRASSILVSGAAGTGKSSLGAHLVAAAVERGEGAIYVSFEEAEGELMRNMRSIGLDLQPMVDDGRLTIITTRASDIGLEEHLLRVLEGTESSGVTTLVLDPVSNFDAIGSQSEVRSMLARLVDRVKSHGITLMMTALTDEASGESHDVALSSIVDVWLTVRNMEADGERNRAMYIMKARGIAHSNQVREFVLSDKGISLIDAYIGPGKVLTGSARVSQMRRDDLEVRMLEGELDRLREELAVLESPGDMSPAGVAAATRKSELRGRIAQVELQLEERELSRHAVAVTRGSVRPETEVTP